MKHKNIGDSFDSFLEEEGLLEKQEINIDINVYYDTNEGIAILNMEDWHKILEILKLSKANLNVKDNREIKEK